MAKENGVELSPADAENYFLFLKGNGALSDTELENVAGGKLWDDDEDDSNYKYCKYCN